MKEFFGRYSYKIVKMFVTQIAIGLFGAVLSFAVMDIGDMFLTVTSIFSILFYLFLVYTTAWEIGAADRISIDVKKLKRRPYRGFILAFIANVPQIIVASVYTVCMLIGRGAAGLVTNIAAVLKVVMFFINGMFAGLLSTITIGTRIDNVGNIVPNELFNFSWAYFIIIIPAVLTGGLAYWLGTKNAKLTTLMDPVYPESDRDQKIKKEKKKED